MVEARMSQRERTPLSLEELQRQHGRPLRTAESVAGHVHRGRLVGYGEDDDGTRYAVLDTGRELTAVPAGRVQRSGTTFALGRCWPPKKSASSAAYAGCWTTWTGAASTTGAGESHPATLPPGRPFSEMAYCESPPE